MYATVVAASACGRLGFDDSTAPDGSDGPLAVSCAGLAPTCGPAGSSPCCDSALVPGGAYFRSYDLAGDGMFGTTMFPATVSDFRLDRYEVTVGRFRQFVDAGMGTQALPPAGGAGVRPGLPASGWEGSYVASLPADTPSLVAALKCHATQATWTDAPGGNESRPINCITWFEAMAFCIWDGGFLPTEAEWNYAASGGPEQRAYPWSSPPSSLTIDASRTRATTSTPSSSATATMIPGCALTDLVPVGSKPAGNGARGHADLTGNVWEWSLDWYGAYPVPCIDCANLTPFLDRVIRGGGYVDDETYVRSGSRTNMAPRDSGAFIGVRCARPP